ncbi:MAG: hypothetical protein A2V77_11370 [Anaeromyxobacter sp. RBG_16_69_14]|nr:MAG: hypothetical protein A2V77_11370 [Anaeromyxobacter sp. RBG_16_69_14]
MVEPGWSDGEEKGARTVLQGTGIELRFFRMDAKRHPERAKAMGLEARAVIESFKPGAVVVSDDIAARHVLRPFFQDAELPFVFCGVNWDATKYGLPYVNATGMLEVSFARQMLDTLRHYARGTRVAYLTVDSETERTEAAAYKEQLGVEFAVEKYVTTASAWKAAFVELQGQVDILFLGNYIGTSDAWNEADMAAFVVSNSKIISGSIHDFMSPYAMVNFAKVPEEHGIWAAKTALAVLGGARPSSIEITRNTQSKIVLNPKLAARAGIVLTRDLLRNSLVTR